ncbi:MAG: outer membrane protein assembly factor BamD [Myxococcota bacterium]|nr:outer membrane protein assembly factor BamD [Myxococcota bacterium]
MTLAAFLVSIFFVNCATSSRLEGLKPGSPEYLYEASMVNIDDGLYPEAVQGFSKLKNNFPYSAFARLADLRIGDTLLAQRKYQEAISSFNRFIRYSPKHEAIPEALYKIAEADYERRPSDFVLLPPAAEKDQKRVNAALRAYRRLTARYPNSEFSRKAAQRIIECSSRLADHEFYVANFYFKKGKFKAALARSLYLLEEFPASSVEDQALAISTESYLTMGELLKAEKQLAILSKKYPKYPSRNALEKRLESLKAIETQQKQPGNPKSKEQ